IRTDLSNAEEIEATKKRLRPTLGVKPVPLGKILCEIPPGREATPPMERPLGSRPDWLFDIDALTRTMNYEPISVGTQYNGFAGTKASDNAGQARKKTEPVKDYILLPLWTTDPPFSQDPKSSHDGGFKPSSDHGKKVDGDPRKENECKDQEKEDNVNSTDNVSTVSSTVNAADTNEDNELPFC
nr:hypothetical protein [Tanacetum cinerariifolium]